MVNSIEYKKAYVELYEIIKRLPQEKYEKIPKEFINNLYNNRDKEYYFAIDSSKGILGQKLKIETKALLVEVYEKYLAPEEERNFWEKYDKICYNMIEEKRKKDYNVDNIFDKKVVKGKEDVAENKNEENYMIEYKECFFIKFKNFILRILHIDKK